ncbi:ankyrin [Nemania sp. NC0429]|nr:ankyrin [Nemania sp. NC0429]
MAPSLSEEEIDDLVYLARAGEDAELTEMLQELATRDAATPADILLAAREDQSKATCLHMAAANGHAMPAKTKASVTAAPPAAAESESEEKSEPAAKAGPASSAHYIDAQNSFGNTALHWACLGGHLDVVKLLLSRGASPALVNDKDQIPLDLAAFGNHMHVVDHFLAQSKDIEGGNAQDGGGLVNETRDLDVEDDADHDATTNIEANG